MKLRDGGALVVALVFGAAIGGLVYEKKVHDMKQLKQVTTYVDGKLCPSLGCTKPVPTETMIPSANNRNEWIDNAGKRTLPF